MEAKGVNEQEHDNERERQRHGQHPPTGNGLSPKRRSSTHPRRCHQREDAGGAGTDDRERWLQTGETATTRPEPPSRWLGMLKSCERPPPQNCVCQSEPQGWSRTRHLSLARITVSPSPSPSTSVPGQKSTATGRAVVATDPVPPRLLTLGTEQRQPPPEDDAGDDSG